MASFFGTLFSKEKEEKKEVIEEEKEEEIQQANKIDPSATMIQNEIYCNGCGQIIEGTPKFFNMNGRKMVFHKKCFKKIKSGNIQL